ncbi:MAG TPA: hypothetical protein VNN20_04015 [Thermodesulfobacteriota bacterium]|nr:hypothetical protein [Thermodesulfobacteriota bacterium]
MVLKLIFKKVCPKCGIVHKKVAFEGTKEEFRKVEELDIPPFLCCEELDADSYEITIDEQVTKKGQIEDMFDVSDE